MLGVLIISGLSVLAIGLWIVAIFTEPNQMTHQNLEKLAPIEVDQAGNASSSVGGGASAPSGSSAATGSGTAAGAASGPPGPHFSNLPFPTPNPSSLTLMATSMPGYTIFENTCAACHGTNAQGQIGPSLVGIGNEASAPALVKVITAGIAPGMPPMGTLTNPADVQKVAAWLAAQKQK